MANGKLVQGREQKQKMVKTTKLNNKYKMHINYEENIKVLIKII